MVDINDDGTSIFGTPKPTLSDAQTGIEWSAFAGARQLLEKDSVITLDVDEVSSVTAGEDLTVQLDLDAVT